MLLIRKILRVGGGAIFGLSTTTVYILLSTYVLFTYNGGRGSFRASASTPIAATRPTTTASMGPLANLANLPRDDVNGHPIYMVIRGSPRTHPR